MVACVFTRYELPMTPNFLRVCKFVAEIPPQTIFRPNWAYLNVIVSSRKICFIACKMDFLLTI